jgi:hypothetical protein
MGVKLRFNACDFFLLNVPDVFIAYSGTRPELNIIFITHSKRVLYKQMGASFEGFAHNWGRIFNKLLNQEQKDL